MTAVDGVAEEILSSDAAQAPAQAGRAPRPAPPEPRVDVQRFDAGWIPYVILAAGLVLAVVLAAASYWYRAQ